MILRGNNDEMLTDGKGWKEAPEPKHEIQTRMFGSSVCVQYGLCVSEDEPGLLERYEE